MWQKIKDFFTGLQKSNLFGINIKDIEKGLYTAVGGALAQYIYNALLDHNWQSLNLSQMQHVALMAFIGYITKNFFSNSKGQLLKKE